MSLSVPVRYLVQQFINKGVFEKKEVERLWTAIQEHHSITIRTNIGDVLKQINDQLYHQKLMIQESICNLTGNVYLVLSFFGKEAENITCKYAKKELDTFHSVLSQLIQDEQLTIQFFTLSKSDRAVISKFINDKYFVKQDENIYLGVRSICQLFSIIKHSPVFKKLNKCIACSSLVYYGEQCKSCRKPMHRYCEETYFSTQTTCPNCQKTWVRN